jgi:transposase-like protein
MVDNVKKPFIKMEMTSLIGRGFFGHKRTSLSQYSEELKREAVRLYESGVSSREVARRLNIRQMVRYQYG